MRAAAAQPGSVLTTDPVRIAAGALAVVVTAGLAVGAPLLTYSVSLALFGLAHVAAELRYVGRRFGPRLQGSVVGGLSLLLVAVVALRMVKQTGVWGGVDRLQAELLVVVALGALALPALLRRGGVPLGVGILVTGGVLAGLLTAPIWTVLVLACLHNFTPVGFLAEALRGADRRRALTLSAVVFLAMPALIATGLPATLMDALGLYAPGVSVLPTGPLKAQLGAYLPAALHDRGWAQHAFSALVFAQCMHYAAVIHVLPDLADRIGAPAERPTMKRTWRVLTVVVAGTLILLFLADFKEARGWYGIFAAVHAWSEVPLLLLAMVPAMGRRAAG